MILQEEVNKHLAEIKAVKGVENCVLTQRDGNPIQSAGVWLSQDEMFRVSSATSAVYNCALELHKDKLKYILIEGSRAKLMLAPLRNTDNQTLDNIGESQGIQGSDDDFFIAISTAPNVNLAGIFLKVRSSLIAIRKALIMSGESFKPELDMFSKMELTPMYEAMTLRGNIDVEGSFTVKPLSIGLSLEISSRIESAIASFKNKITNLERCFLCFDGGYLTNPVVRTKGYNPIQLDSEASMTYSIFETADQCSWFLKKMRVQSVLIECTDNLHFINKVGNGLFSALIDKDNEKLGLLRMVMPVFVRQLEQILEDVQSYENTIRMFDPTALFTEIIIK